MTQSGGTVIKITVVNNDTRLVEYQGNIKANDFENTLRKLADGKSNSWSFSWS